MNVFENTHIARNYDDYYLTDTGRRVDQIETSMIRGLLRGVPRSDLLEVGCGTGHWTGFFAGEGFNVSAVDVSEAMLSIAREKRINAHFRPGDALALEQGDNSLPVVASITVLEFVDSAERAVREMYRVLQPGGLLVLGFLNSASVLGANAAGDEVFGTARFFSETEIRTLLDSFAEVNTIGGVYQTGDFTIVDGTPEQAGVEPVFIGASARKGE